MSEGAANKALSDYATMQDAERQKWQKVLSAVPTRAKQNKQNKKKNRFLSFFGL